MRGFLTGKGNFRNGIAKTKPYKGNRDPLSKPSRYAEIREYLVKRFEAEIIDGYEADDKIAMLHRPGESVVVSIDKDLRQLPGLHYDWRKEKFIEVSEEDARRNFWTQVLTGDASDNIPGLPGIGPKKAAILLPEGQTDQLYSEVVRSTYNEHFKKKAKDLPPEEVEAKAMEYLTENAQLLYLLRHENDQWRFPT